MKVKTLKANFLEEFGLTLRVYDRRSFADPEATLASIRKGDSKGGEFSPRKNTKVGNLEDKIFEMFGLKTQVSGSDDRYLCDNDLTLNTAQQEDEKKSERKELKAERQKNSKKGSKRSDVKYSSRIVCLNFESILSTLVETEDGDYLDDPEDIGEYRFKGTEHLDAKELTLWCHNNLDIEFDGDLDNPELFKSITAIKLFGPNLAEYGEEGLIIEDASFYLEVESETELDEDDLDDLFHMAVPKIEIEGCKMAFTEFEEYQSSFEDVPEDGKRLSVIWKNDTE